MFRKTGDSISYINSSFKHTTNLMSDVCIFMTTALATSALDTRCYHFQSFPLFYSDEKVTNTKDSKLIKC